MWYDENSKDFDVAISTRIRVARNLKDIKLLSDTATLPTRGSKYAAGYDLYANIDESYTIMPHSTVKIPTGIAVELPEGYFAGIYARSGLATKKGLRPANCVGK